MIVRAINDKARNYWRRLKGKVKKEGIQVVSDTHGFKFETTMVFLKLKTARYTLRYA